MKRETTAGSPRVSVIVPVRNAEATIADTLDAVLRQDYDGPLEVIVADGSDTPALSALVGRRYPQVRLVPNPERIASTGLNRALRTTKGEVVFRCDAHTTLPPGYVRRAVETLERTGAANVGGRKRPVGVTFFERAVATAMSTFMGTGGTRSHVPGSPEGPVDTVFMGAFRREALDAVGGYDPSLVRNQDYELNWRLRQRGEIVWLDPELVAFYKPRSTLGSLARQYFEYGRWKRVVLTRSPSSAKARQLAVPLFMLALVASGVLALTGAPMPLPVAMPATYVGTLVVGSSIVGLRRREWSAVLLPLVLAAMHVSWAVGFFFPVPPKAPAPTTEPVGGRRAGPGVKNPAPQLKCMVASTKGSARAAESPRRRPTTNDPAINDET